MRPPAPRCDASSRERPSKAARCARTGRRGPDLRPPPRARTAPSRRGFRRRVRRRSPRGTYTRSILATRAGRAQVLIGRDLSTGGMRVNPDPQLLVGQELKLVIYGVAGREPVVVKAVVARDEGRDGCVLRFPGLSADARSRLEAIVSALPDTRAADAGARAPNVVVSEVVELAR
jgi:hypothetical protein